MTPMMKQYLAVKEDYKDTILFFRLGDFYEMFLDDAVIASRELGLTLTSRSKGAERDKNPMCGVPFHAADLYISKLVSKGYKVAICEQLEDPKMVKGIVKRDVVKVVTPGTITDTNALDDKSNNYLCAIYRGDICYGIAFADITTGDFFVTEALDSVRLINEIARYNPSEIILNALAFKDALLVGEIKNRFSCLCEQTKFEPQWENSVDLILSRMEKDSLLQLGIPQEIHTVNATGQMLLYLENTQKSVLGNLKQIKYYNSNEYMDIDIFTRRNLELTETMRTASRKGTLLSVLDKTKTSMGGRMMRSFIEKPLINCAAIQKRLYAVSELIKAQETREDLKEILKSVSDIERLIGKVAAKTAKKNDLISLKQSLKCLPYILNQIGELTSAAFCEMCAKTDTLSDIFELIDKSIYEDKEGEDSDRIIKEGFSEELDEYYNLMQNGKSAVLQMEASEKERTGIKTLKVSYNKVFGYYIEVSKSYKDMLPEGYIRKQTIANGERYITAELKELEEKIFGASEKIKTLESMLFSRVRDEISNSIERILDAADTISYVDVLCSLADVAVKNNYTMPHVDMSDKLEITDGRHPVVEKMLSDELFVPNDTFLNCEEDRLLIITGPNMAGKSTYMRQVALITIMAQIGSFVPAKECHIGICDKVFTRVGASDDLSAGQSTFMVEMTEVSNILQHATKRSLLILDEIGRGTSTYDGLSIAWSVCEYVADKSKIGARTLFATHYHELTELEDKLDGVKNYCVACKKRGDEITFLRRIIKGGADESYGIEVAALAGLPSEVINRAKDILACIDGTEKETKQTVREKAEPQAEFKDVRGNEIIEELEKMDLSTYTPIEALNKLYEFQKIAKK
ncbi:MAG: DNA mismatch repair protein MutS [Ruminococcaceae bacterium]|nr:DNA mismatch repair protein MutS [Oscillospiraceae bacterium]